MRPARMDPSICSMYINVCRSTCVCLLVHLILIPTVSSLEHTTVIEMKFIGICGQAIMASSVTLAAAAVTPRFGPDTSGVQYDDTVRSRYLGLDPALETLG